MSACLANSDKNIPQIYCTRYIIGQNCNSKVEVEDQKTTSQDQDYKNKTEFCWSETGLVIKTKVSDHITDDQ